MNGRLRISEAVVAHLYGVVANRQLLDTVSAGVIGLRSKGCAGGGPSCRDGNPGQFSTRRIGHVTCDTCAVSLAYKCSGIAKRNQQNCGGTGKSSRSEE